MKHLNSFSQLFESKKKYRDLVQGIKDICIDLEDDGFIVSVQRSTYWMSGVTGPTGKINRFSPSNANDANSKKAVVINISISKSKFQWNLHNEKIKFNTSEVRGTLDRIISFLGDDFQPEFNKDIPEIKARFNTSGISGSTSEYTIDKWNDVDVIKIDFNLHVK